MQTRKPALVKVTQSKLQQIDFRYCPLQVGAQVDTCQDRWTQLDQSDMHLLYRLLTIPIGDAGAAADSSPGLRILAQYAAAAVQWYKAKEDLTAQQKAG